jgi:NADH-quinone oxidoreductase subunit M
MPLYALMFMVFTMANVGLPGLRLRRRILDPDRHLQGLDTDHRLSDHRCDPVGLLRVMAYRKIVFGVLVKPSLASIKDLTARECLLLMPLVILTILLGFYPKPVLDISVTSAKQLVDNYGAAATVVKAAAPLP